MKKIFLAAAVLISLQGLAQNFTPRVKLTPGKKYRVINISKGSMVQEAMGQSMEIPMELSNYCELVVKSPTDAGGYRLSNSINRMVIFISLMGQEMSYDSDKKEDRDSDMGKSLNGLLNQTTTFDINSFGRVIESSVVKPAAPNTDIDMANPLLKMLGVGADLGGASAAVNIFAADATLQPGQSYTDTSGSDAAEKISSSFTYTLTGVQDGIASFTISGKTTLAKELDMQGMQATVNTSTTITGDMQVNAATGLLIKKTVNMAVKGNTEMAGMQIPQSGNTVVTVTVEEIK